MTEIYNAQEPATRHMPRTHTGTLVHTHIMYVCTPADVTYTPRKVWTLRRLHATKTVRYGRLAPIATRSSLGLPAEANEPPA